MSVVFEVVDYRKFLSREETRVLPYLGGRYVVAADRRLRVSGEPAPGWWRFVITGRDARADAPAEPEGLEELPLVRGHLLSDRLFTAGAHAELVGLLPEEQPPRFSPVRTRRAPAGALVFESVDFEGDAEEAARRAFEEERTLSDHKGVPATLRAAFGFAVLMRVADARGVAVSPVEARDQLLDLSERGPAAASAFLDALEDQRRFDAARREAWARRDASRAPRGGAVEGPHDVVRSASRLRDELSSRAGRRRRAASETPEERAERALFAAGAHLTDVRRLGGGQLEVRYSFLGERFISVADADTLQVYDAGVCLDGSDREVTLESLPSVIREAIETGQLVITRRQ
jgi:hypothetical protein